MAVTSKPFWQSSTLWINVLGIVALVLNFLLVGHVIVDPQVVALLVAVLNIINRLRPQFTDASQQIKPLTLK